MAIETPLWDCLSIGISAGGYASYACTHLSAKEDLITGTFITTTTLTEVETLHHKWSGKFKGSAELGWRVRRAFLSVIGNYEYWGYMPKILNPKTSLSPPVHVGNSHSHNWSVGFKITAPLLSNL